MRGPASVWIEVDLGAICHNLREVRRLVGAKVKVLAVVKANAYGHGAVETARALAADGADCLGVTRVEDALELREASVRAPILVFNSSLPEDAAAIVKQDLEQTACDLELAEALSKAAVAQGKTVAVHVKIDTGMGRLGVSPAEAPAFARHVSGLPGLKIAGVYTHLASASAKDRRPALAQLRVFDEVLADLKAAGISCGTLHAAASAALLAIPESRYGMVRPGTVLYGQYPSSHVPQSLDLRSTWALKTRVAFVKEVPKGAAIGYGRDYRTRRTSRIAILPVGYADGVTMAPEGLLARKLAANLIRRGLTGRRSGLSVTISGKSAPIVGRIGMEMCAVDVTDLPSTAVGDEALLPCRRTSASSRIPRVYVGNAGVDS